MIMLCVLIYVRTGCGLRTVVDILGIFEEVMDGACDKAPSYKTVGNWVRKLVLSIYNEDRPLSSKYVTIRDESIMVNKEKLLFTLGIEAEHQGRPVTHGDTVVLGMQIGSSFKKEDVKKESERITEKMGSAPEYDLSDGGYNLVGWGARLAEVPHHLDICHSLGNCMKRVYGEDAEFVALTTKLGKSRLQYHLTDKAWVLPPNMRAIARFMNLEDGGVWAVKMLGCIDTLEDECRKAFSFLKDYTAIINELHVCVKAIRHVETLINAYFS